MSQFTISASQEILESTASLPAASEIEEVTGRFDIMVTVKARSLDDLHNVVVAKIGNIDGVNRSETFIGLKIQRQTPVFEAWQA